MTKSITFILAFFLFAFTSCQFEADPLIAQINAIEEADTTVSAPQEAKEETDKSHQWMLQADSFSTQILSEHLNDDISHLGLDLDASKEYKPFLKLTDTDLTTFLLPFSSSLKWFKLEPEQYENTSGERSKHHFSLQDELMEMFVNSGDFAGLISKWTATLTGE
jgi:hypothetical protein